MTIPAKTMFLQIGRRRYQVASLQQASEMWERARDASGLGASQIGGDALIVNDSGATVAYVSYNGRVWAGQPGRPGHPGSWTSDATPLYDNRIERAPVVSRMAVAHA